MLKLDIEQALHFLDTLDPGGRHTIASEAPFGRPDGGPKWEQGATYEARQRKFLIQDIQERQARGSNVYYSVNRPCPVIERQGFNGKNNVDDIIAIRALAFDIDFTVPKNAILVKSLLDFVTSSLDGHLRPSMTISTGGGFQLIYVLKEPIKVQLFPPAANDEQEQVNDQVTADRSAITNLAHEFESMLRRLIPASLPIKIDNMSNIDRVMRLPGTINYPKAEKIAKGQLEALAHIEVDYQCKCDIYSLRAKVPRISEAAPAKRATRFVPRANSKWSTYRKALACCQFIKDQGLADSNEWYTINIMLPLLGAADDGELTIPEAEECFMLAVSGGERYETMGRGPGYFRRQWKSHLNSNRSGRRTLGSLIWVCKKSGMALPWVDSIVWEESFKEQLRELSELRQTADEQLMNYLERCNAQSKNI